MTLAAQIALTATPLSAYFYALGVFQGGRRPCVVRGSVDAGLLALGLGGLLAFGPIGQAVMGRVVGAGAGPIHWAAWVGLLALWALAFSSSAARRLAVYNVTADELDRAVREALAGLGGGFAPTLGGFEDASRGSGLKVGSVRALRAGSVEAIGHDPEALIAALRPRLRLALARAPRGPSTLLSAGCFGLAGLAMLGPMAWYLAGNPRAQNAVRALMHSLRWW